MLRLGKDSVNVYASLLNEVKDEDIDYSYRKTDVLADPFGNIVPVEDVNGFWCLKNFGSSASVIKVGSHPNLDPALVVDFVVCTLAHELGHYFDLAFRPDVQEVLTAYSYGKQEKNRAKEAQSRKDQIAMYNIEDRAWSNGFEILKRHGYQNFPFYMEVKEDGLASYSGSRIL